MGKNPSRDQEPSGKKSTAEQRIHKNSPLQESKLQVQAKEEEKSHDRIEKTKVMKMENQE